MTTAGGRARLEHGALGTDGPSKSDGGLRPPAVRIGDVGAVRGPHRAVGLQLGSRTRGGQTADDLGAYRNEVRVRCQIGDDTRRARQTAVVAAHVEEARGYQDRGSPGSTLMHNLKVPGTRMRGRSDSDVVEDLIRQYLREIGAHPLLTAADEIRLAIAMELGREADAILAAARPHDLSPERLEQLEAASAAGDAAKRQFIVSNLRLVVSIAKRYRSAGLPFLDLVQEGNLGLIRAVEKFDHTRECRFSTYATWWIRQAVTRAVADKARTIRLPAHMVELARRVKAATARKAETLAREPTIEEIAAEAGVSTSAVLEVQHLIPDAVSLQAPVSADGTELSDVLEDTNMPAPFEVAAASLQREDILAAMATLTEREQKVLELRFGLQGDEPETLDEIGQRFRLTRERIRQIEAKALARLRHPSTPSNRRQLLAVERARSKRRRAGGARTAPARHAVS